jgi:hypothetical protein
MYTERYIDLSSVFLLHFLSLHFFDFITPFLLLSWLLILCLCLPLPRPSSTIKLTVSTESGPPHILAASISEGSMEGPFVGWLVPSTSRSASCRSREINNDDLQSKVLSFGSTPSATLRITSVGQIPYSGGVSFIRDQHTDGKLVH